jgi:hypothetical protein
MTSQLSSALRAVAEGIHPDEAAASALAHFTMNGLEAGYSRSGWPRGARVVSSAARMSSQLYAPRSSAICGKHPRKSAVHRYWATIFHRVAFRQLGVD